MAITRDEAEDFANALEIWGDEITGPLTEFLQRTRNKLIDKGNFERDEAVQICASMVRGMITLGTD